MTSLVRQFRRQFLKKTLGACIALAVSTLAVAPLCAQALEELRLVVGKSIVLDYPGDIRQISTSDPAIVDALAVSTREVLLHAKGTGTATVVVWSRTGQRTIYSLVVEQNLEPLRRLLKETFPNEDLQAQSSRDSVSITGRATTKEVADRAVALATPFGKTVVNNVRINAGPIEKQIVLRVKFVELNRAMSQAFGVNLISGGAAGTIGRTTTGQFPAPQPEIDNGVARFSITDALNIFAFRPDLNLGAFIRALNSEGVLQILAEPNLVTTNGKEASFLVGGEFPVPILQGGGNAGAVTVQFREFGIRLNFNPLITEHGTIKMFVRPEVSTIDLGNAVTVSGFLIPALATRRMETNIELGEGQSFVIAGLIDDRMNDSVNKVPGLGNVPLLGALFRSREERKNHTELVVIVTPEITRPLAPGENPMPIFPREFMEPIAPGDGSKPPMTTGPERSRTEDHSGDRLEIVKEKTEKGKKSKEANKS